MLDPLPSSQWNSTTAAHLLNRAGFGGSPEDVENLRLMGPDKAVSFFVDYQKIPDDTPPLEWAQPDPQGIATRDALLKASDPYTRFELDRQHRIIERSQMGDLRYWWLRRMAIGPRPFQEKMTLFWHGHFATSFEKVQSPYFLWLQNDTIRQNATSDFSQLLIAVSEDPAMLLYLDGARSNKNKPNENFAREVLELFTMGEGNYTEHDIQESAKAYTGWGITRDRCFFQYQPNNHDPGPKTVFGQTGNFNGEDLLNLICQQPQCAKYICAKIWRFFVQDSPPQPVVDALATEFQTHNMNIKNIMRKIFRSKEFYADDVIRSQIKSPVQWLISSAHQLEAPLPTKPMSLVMLSSLGQELFNPPNVKGWDGGIAWMTTTSVLDRYNFAAALVEGERIRLPGLEGQMKGVMSSMSQDGLMQLTPAALSGLFTPDQLSTPDNFLTALQNRFLNGTLKPQRLDPLRDFLKSRSPIEEADVRKSIRLLMSTPEYQLC